MTMQLTPAHAASLDVWDCLAADTRILLADGTAKAIQHVTKGDVVVSDGGDRPVLATMAQPHHGPVLFLTFTNGVRLVTSLTHPMMTPGGAIQAASLKVGDQVRTAHGDTTAVRGIKDEAFRGQVYNLWLDPTRPGDTTMVANGVFVGDHLVQGRALREAATDEQHRNSAAPRGSRAYLIRSWSIVQLVSQVFPPSSENACSQWQELGVMSRHT